MPETNRSHPLGPLAILADIHGNIDALTAVLRDVAAQGCRAIVCLGDIVGYGPEPGECVRMIRKYAGVSLVGNHEAMFHAIPRPLPGVVQEPNELLQSLALCRGQLTRGDKVWLQRLPLVSTMGDATFVHASLKDPHEFDYIYDQQAAAENFAAQESQISFHGHTHVPTVWVETAGKVRSFKPGENPVILAPVHRYAVCVGSVGQPRDRDPRAAYVIYDPAGDRFIVRRVEYDIDRARRRFTLRGLLGLNAQRIARGE